MAQISCATAGRSPAALGLKDDGIWLPGTREFSDQAEATLRFVSSPGLNSENCLTYLTRMQERIALARPEGLDKSDLRKTYPAIAEKLWSIRLKLHERLPEFPAACASEMRNVFRAIRSIEDYFGEWYYGDKPVLPTDIAFMEQPVPILDKTAYHGYFIAPKMDLPGSFQFKSGDLMITRGISFLSATIARISDIHSQFSHVVLVHVEEGSGKTSTIESYVGKGVGIYPIDEALKNENARILVLRPRNAALGKEAAEWMRQTAQTRIDQGSPIPYDYKLDFRDHTALSCAEVASYAYEVKSGGSFILPQYPSMISLRNVEFLNNVNLREGELFAPGDLEIDPRFELILDWRDYRLIRDSRYKDAILSSMFDWMDRLGYRLHDTVKSIIATHVIWPARRTFLWPLVSRVTGVSDFALELSRATFGTMALLNQIGEALLEEITKRDLEFEKKTGWPMTTVELSNALEEIRKTDFEDFKADKDTLFHFGFQPAKDQVLY